MVSDGGASAGPMDGGTTVRVASGRSGRVPGSVLPGELFSCGVFCASASGVGGCARNRAVVGVRRRRV